MSEERRREKVVVVHHAGTATEAVVIRSLLESAGLDCPDTSTADMFPMREPPEGFDDTAIRVLESQAEEARRILADYLSRPEVAEAEEPSADETDSR